MLHHRQSISKELPYWESLYPILSPVRLSKNHHLLAIFDRKAAPHLGASKTHAILGEH